MDTKELVKTVTEVILKELHINNRTNTETSQDLSNQIPVGVSNRHVHLSEGDLYKLYGDGAKLTNFKDLSQPGQFACEEKVTLVGLKGVIENVRILGPVRSKTQIELSISDCIKLGVKAPIRDSGDLCGSPGLTLVGPKGAVTINEGTIVAARHVHMHTNDAIRFRVKDGQRISIRASGPRETIFNEVLVRVSDKYKLEVHLDFDEANAAGLTNNSTVEIVNMSF
ncbi:MAG: phosphate propanoyltransferase [Peptococcales bacterium]